MGSGTQGIVWQLNRLAYYEYAKEHSIDLSDVVVTDLDEAHVLLAVSRFTQNLDATAHTIIGLKKEIEDKNNEEASLRACLEEIHATRASVIQQLENSET